MHKMTKACKIPDKVKKVVLERDNGICVYCESYGGIPNAHYIARAHGGLGIEENVVCLCHKCHAKYDNSENRNIIKPKQTKHLKSHYSDWDEEKLIYRKCGG